MYFALQGMLTIQTCEISSLFSFCIQENPQKVTPFLKVNI